MFLLKQELHLTEFHLKGPGFLKFVKLPAQSRMFTIPGTGCNAAYVEDVENLEKWTGSEDDPFKQVYVLYDSLKRM